MKITILNTLVTIIGIMACNKGTVGNTATVITNPPIVTTVSRTVNVSNASQLMAALANAKPGDDIIMADGTYKGKFVIPAGVNGDATNKITLRGSRNAVIDGGDINTGYALYLQSNYWLLKGFTVTNALKGLMCDGANYNTIDSLFVHNTGEEAIHFRKFSTHNLLQNCTVTNAGLKTPDYGEGVYIGSAISNWPTYTNGAEDRCDSNTVLNNKIGPGITAECIDVKEGTTGGIIRGNSFDATGITGANSGDSWIDVKGNNTLIENNTGFNPSGSVLADGYQVHCAEAGWGNNTVFKNNTCNVNAAGYGFNITLSSSKGTVTGTVVYKSNTVNGAVKGVSNIALTN